MRVCQVSILGVSVLLMSISNEIYTLLQISTIAAYLFISLFQKNLIKYLVMMTIFVINITITIILLKGQAFNGDIIVVFVLSWIAIILIVFLDRIYWYQDETMNIDASPQINLYEIRRLTVVIDNTSDNTSDNNNVCSICLNNIEPPKYITKCHHTYCKNCLDTWMLVQLTCPICRQLLIE